MSLEFDPIDEVLESLRQGHPIIVTDDANRENEGDLILAAEKATAETLSFMIRYTSGVICVPMEGSDLDRLELPLMTLRNNEAMRTAYTISVDAKSLPIAPQRSASFPTLPLERTIWFARDMYSRCATARGASCAGPDTRRPPSILLG
jgi:hypothetical protein